MKSLFASILLTLAACGGGSSSSTTANHPTGEPMVDPTVPSWLPASCVAYHKAVVQAIDCQAVDQGTRDQIRSTFDATSTSWKTEEPGADKAKIDEIGARCTTATDSVRTDIGGKCV